MIKYFKSISISQNTFFKLYFKQKQYILIYFLTIWNRTKSKKFIIWKIPSSYLMIICLYIDNFKCCSNSNFYCEQQTELHSILLLKLITDPWRRWHAKRKSDYFWLLFLWHYKLYTIQKSLIWKMLQRIDNLVQIGWTHCEVQEYILYVNQLLHHMWYMLY